jgi:methionine-rich copper-binding protein CopC
MLPVNRWRERRKSWLFVLPLATLLALLSAGPAFAHTRLNDTSPGDGKQLASVPRTVSLTFSGEVLKLGAAVKVNGPDGAVETGTVKLKGRTVSWPFAEGLANGRYTVSWRVTSGDGHPIDGRFGFVLRVPVEPTGTPGPAGADPGLTPTPAATAHTADPQMTGPMEGMEGMPGMATRSPTAEGGATGSTTTTVLAITGLVLLTVVVSGAIVIERRRRPPRAAGPSGPSSD